MVWTCEWCDMHEWKNYVYKEFISGSSLAKDQEEDQWRDGETVLKKTSNEPWCVLTTEVCENNRKTKNDTERHCRKQRMVEGAGPVVVASTTESSCKMKISPDLTFYYFESNKMLVFSGNDFLDC